MKISDLDELNWLLLNGKEQQSFGSSTTMDCCNYDWRSTSRKNGSIKQYELHHCSNPLCQIINQKSNTEMKSKMKISLTQNASLIPLLLCIVLVFFMLLTVLLIMVIFLSTRRTATTITGRWNTPFNGTFTHANRIRQNSCEVNYSFYFIHSLILIQ